jgi:hypothetical protein
MEAMEQRGLRGLVTVEHARLVVEMLVPREVKGVKEQQEFLAVVAELRIPVRPIRVLTVIQEQEETEVQAVAAEQEEMSVLPIMEEREEMVVLLRVLLEVLAGLKAMTVILGAMEQMGAMERRALQGL